MMGALRNGYIHLAVAVLLLPVVAGIEFPNYNKIMEVDAGDDFEVACDNGGYGFSGMGTLYLQIYLDQIRMKCPLYWNNASTDLRECFQATDGHYCENSAWCDDDDALLNHVLYSGRYDIENEDTPVNNSALSEKKMARYTKTGTVKAGNLRISISVNQVQCENLSVTFRLV